MQNKFIWYALLTFCFLVLIAEYIYQAPNRQKADDFKVTIKYKNISIPAAYRATNYGTGQFHSSVYFRIDAERLAPTYADPAKDKSIVSVFLIDDFVGQDDAQKYIYHVISNEIGSNSADCKKETSRNTERQICEYPIDKRTDAKTYVIDNIRSSQDKTIIKCDLNDRDILPNPLCSADGIIFGDTRLHYYFSTSQMKNILRIDSGIREFFKKATFEKAEK